VTAKDLQAQVDTPWSRNDERNWTSNRRVLRDLKKQGEEPSESLASVHRELDARRKARRREEREQKTAEDIRAWAEEKVAEMMPLTEAQWRHIAEVLQS
jgi:chromatin segregation and condensation protein Rec8/ScpA/Scc1 (kleisin family)